MSRMSRMSLLIDQSRSVLPLRSAKAREFGESVVTKKVYARALSGPFHLNWSKPVHIGRQNGKNGKRPYNSLQFHLHRNQTLKLLICLANEGSWTLHKFQPRVKLFPWATAEHHAVTNSLFELENKTKWCTCGHVACESDLVVKLAWQGLTLLSLFISCDWCGKFITCKHKNGKMLCLLTSSLVLSNNYFKTM